jgi:hypothetical protein
VTIEHIAKVNHCIIFKQTVQVRKKKIYFQDFISDSHTFRMRTTRNSAIEQPIRVASLRQTVEQ